MVLGFKSKKQRLANDDHDIRSSRDMTNNGPRYHSLKNNTASHGFQNVILLKDTFSTKRKTRKIPSNVIRKIGTNVFLFITEILKNVETYGATNLHKKNTQVHTVCFCINMTFGGLAQNFSPAMENLRGP